MRITQRLLRWIHPKAESDRMAMREMMARAHAEAEDLSQTIRMDAIDFEEMMERERKRELTLAHDSPWNTVEFFSFAESCDYRKPAGKDGIASICKHPGHEAAGTGIASCSKAMCPRARELK